MRSNNIGGNFGNNCNEHNTNHDKLNDKPKSNPNDDPKDNLNKKKNKRHIICAELYEPAPILINKPINQNKIDNFEKNIDDRIGNNPSDNLGYDMKKKSYGGYKICDELFETAPILIDNPINQKKTDRFNKKPNDRLGYNLNDNLGNNQEKKLNEEYRICDELYEPAPIIGGENVIDIKKVTSLEDKNDENKYYFLKSNNPIDWNLHIGSNDKLNSLSKSEKETYKEIMLLNALNIYKFITDDIKLQKKMKGEEVNDFYFPKTPDLKEFGYETFYDAIKSRCISIKDIYKKVEIPLENITILEKSSRQINWNLHIGSNDKLDSLPEDEKDSYRDKMLKNSVNLYKHIADEIIIKKKLNGEKINCEYNPKYSDLRDFGYRSFEKAIYDRGITLGKIKSHLEESFEKLIDKLRSGENINWSFHIGSIKKLESLQDDEKEVYREIMLTNASKIYEKIVGDVMKKKEMNDDYLDNEYITNITEPEEFRYKSFEKAIIDRGITIEKIENHLEESLEELINKLKSGENLNWDLYIGSYSDLEILANKEKKVCKEKMLENAANLFKHITEEIKLKKRAKNENVYSGYFPKSVDLRKFGYRSFEDAIKKRGISYQEMYEKIGFTSENIIILIKSNKWINWNYHIGSIKKLDSLHDDEKEAYREEMLINTVNIYELIAEDIIQKKVENEDFLEDGYAPNITELLKYGYSSYSYAFHSRGMSIYDIWERAGLDKKFRIDWDLHIGSIKKLDSLRDAEKDAYREEMLINASNYFEKMVEDIKNKKNINGEFSPKLSDLVEFGYKSFIWAISKRGIYINDIRNQIGLPEIEKIHGLMIGNKIHSILENKFNYITRKKNCLTFSEVYPNSNSQIEQYKQSVIDNTIIIDENSKELSTDLSFFLDSHPNVRMINIDYFMGNSKKYIREHCLRGYQNPQRLLILVPLHSNSIQLPPELTPYPDYVKIMNISTFMEFFGYSDKDKLEIIHIVDVAKKAVWRSDRKSLVDKLDQNIANMAKTSIPYSQTEFKEYIEENNKGKLLTTNGPLDNFLK